MPASRPVTVVFVTVVAKVVEILHIDVLHCAYVDVIKNTDKTEVPNWACYQYKVMQSVIPIKNLIWSE